MIRWDLQDRRILQPLPECAVVCDPGRVTPVMTLFHSGLKGNDRARVTVVSYLDDAPWLEAVLRAPTVRKSLSRADLGPEGTLELALECIQSPTDEERAAVSDDDFRLSIMVSWDQDGPRRDLPIEIRGIRPQTLQQAKPTVSLHPPSDLPELSRQAVVEGLDVVLCGMTVAQPAGTLEYAGEPAKVEATAIVQPLTNGAGGAQATMRRGDLSWPADLRRTDELQAGGTLTFFCSVSAADLFAAAAGESTLAVRIDWTVNVSVAGKPPQREQDSRTVHLHVVQNEILAIQAAGSVAVPKMRSGDIDPATPMGIDFSVPDPTAPNSATGNVTSVEILRLDPAWDTVEAYAAIGPASLGADLAALTRGELILARTQLVERLTASVPLGALMAKVGAQGRSADLQLFIALKAYRGTESVAGVVFAPVAVRERDASYLACIDFGAAAIAAWFGEFRRDADRDLIPLGEFVHAVAGAHSEYDPNAQGRNVLAPSAIGLASDCHLRSRRDPLSLGDLTLVGSDRDTVKRRLLKLGRKYDVSLPAEASIDPGQVIPDLKRRLLNGKSRTAHSVAELENGELGSTTRLDLAALTRDVFRELGSYVIPNAMRLDYKARVVPPDSETPYEQWLESDPSEIQIVLTHPSGVSAEKREVYREAGIALAEEFAGMGASAGIREPKLIPEALAAAYFGITRMRRTSPEGIFACIDIGASTVDASLVWARQERPGAIESWEVLAHFGATVGGANLDEALLALALKCVRRLLPKAGAVHGDLVLDPRHVDDASIKRTLAPEIQRAKRRLSEKLMELAGAQGPYRWGRAGPGEAFRIGLKGIVSGREPGQPLQPRNDLLEHVHGRAWLRVEATDTGGQEAWLEISPDLLDGDTEIESPNRDDPRTVARLLGRGVPAMLIREAERLRVPLPEWIVTGRASLWPSIYDGIARTVAIMCRGRSLAPRPLSAADMKNAIVYGARSLAITGLELTDGAKHPYALVFYEEGDEGIGRIEYLGTERQPQGSRRVPYRANCSLSRVLPGLGERGNRETITRSEIVRLFGTFGQKVTVDECTLRKSGGVTRGPAQEIEISWQPRGALIQFKVGDIVLAVQPNRLAGV